MQFLPIIGGSLAAFQVLFRIDAAGNMLNMFVFFFSRVLEPALMKLASNDSSATVNNIYLIFVFVCELSYANILILRNKIRYNRIHL